MAAGRSLKSLVSRRRRADEEGEDEEGPVMVEDSQSEGSILTDFNDEDADATSSMGGPSAGNTSVEIEQRQPERTASANDAKIPGKKARRTRKKATKRSSKDPSVDLTTKVDFHTPADTVAMLDGLRTSGSANEEETLDFEDMGRERKQTALQKTHHTDLPHPGNGPSDTMPLRPRTEHEEHRKKRDSNPAFIPTRGNFFMHDTRASNGYENLNRGGWNGRGRGRGAGPANSNVGGPYSPAGQVAQAERAAERPWKHDLHHTINEEFTTNKPGGPLSGKDDVSRPQQKENHDQQARVISFSSTTLVGRVQINVFLPGMSHPVAFSEVPWKHYTRLPDHRPPLRRDKPVRISLPGHTQRYIFPSSERSFIFIPRQMRPNQQGLGRNTYQRNLGGGFGYSSRRTSMYGGSMYAASVAASRRSSFASVPRESAFSPVGSFTTGVRPIVRLPHGSQPSNALPGGAPMATPSTHPAGPQGMQVYTFPLPQQPTYQGTPTTTMHQPRPQKAISVTGIESPAAMRLHESQPFQNQLPAHITEPSSFHPQPTAYQSPAQQYHYAPQPQTGTPLSGIPEQAVHASSLQPSGMAYGQYYMPYPQQPFYYPPAPSHGYPSMPMYMQPTQNYMAGPPGSQQQPPPPPQPQQQPPPQQHQQMSPRDEPYPAQSHPQAPPQMPQHDQQSADSHQPPSGPPPTSSSQSGMVAHESNGMVFYLPASEAQQLPQSESYQPAESFVPSYAMPGLPPPTPAPDANYYYHPPQPLAQGLYYPSAPT